MRFTPRSTVALAGLAGLLLPAAAEEYRVTIEAAKVERAGQVVTFKLPGEAPRSAALKASDGTVLPLQGDGQGNVLFIVPAQKANETLTFSIAAVSPAAWRGGIVEAKADAHRVHLSVGDAPVLDFQMDRDALPRGDIKPEFKRAGYIHPVFAPSGRIVTDDYPSTHVHHHGIWSPWTKTKFQERAPDFWNMGAKTGAEDFVALDRTWSGNVHGGFEARLKMVDLSAPAPVAALNEAWRVTAYNVPAGPGRAAVRMFDLSITQTCATADPVILPTYHYGGFGFRGAGAWNGPGEATRFLTSEGVTDRIKGNNTRGRWCYLGGPLEGAIAGTAILGHPENFRAPQPMRLHPDMPYMSFVPQQLGEFAIEPGKPYVARFRFIVTDGTPDRATIDAYWNAFAQPATARVERIP